MEERIQFSQEEEEEGGEEGGGGLAVFFGEEVDADAHGIEFLEEEFAGVGHGNDDDGIAVADGAMVIGGGHGAAVGADGDAEGIGHVKEALEEEAGVAVGDHAIMSDDAIGEEGINLVDFNVVDLLGTTRADSQDTEIHGGKNHGSTITSIGS